MNEDVFDFHCQMCGAKISGKNDRKMYCADCLEIRKKEQGRIWRERHKEKLNARKREAKAKAKSSKAPSGMSINAVVRAALASGRSYGKQVAYMEGRF